MSVTTTADERLEEVREHLVKAQVALAEVLNPGTWGHDDFSNEALQRWSECFSEIIKLRTRI